MYRSGRGGGAYYYNVGKIRVKLHTQSGIGKEQKTLKHKSPKL
jgi:hypothetical protein